MASDLHHESVGRPRWSPASDFCGAMALGRPNPGPSDAELASECAASPGSFRRPGAAGLPSARWCLVEGGRSTTSYSPNPPNAFCDRLVRGRATGVCGGPSRSARRARLPTVLGEAAVQCLAKRMASRVIRSRWFWVSLAAAMSRIRRSTSSCNGRSIRDGSIRDSRRPGSTSTDCRTRELFHTCIRGNNPK